MKRRLDAEAEVHFFGYETDSVIRTFGISIYFVGEPRYNKFSPLGTSTMHRATALRDAIHFAVRDLVCAAGKV